MQYTYVNIRESIRYFGYDGTESQRVTLLASNTVFTLLNHPNGGIDTNTLANIQDDLRFTDIKIFRFVDIPVTGLFSFFDFHFESDIPVFSVSGTSLSGATTPVGFSQALIDFYNTQFAGTASFFPPLSPQFLIGKKIKLAFGNSKIFPPLSTIATPLDATIVTIDPSFPGFGIILPERIVAEKMKEIGYSLGNPYKIVMTLPNKYDREAIERDYTGSTLIFGEDTLKEQQSKIRILALVLGGITFFIVGILTLVFFFLLGGYFREERSLFQMIGLFDLHTLRSFLLTLFAPVCLLILSLFLVGSCWYFFSPFLHASLLSVLASRGLMLPLLPLSLHQILLTCVLFGSICLLGLSFFEKRARKHYGSF